MSSDNFYFTNVDRVYQGFDSDYENDDERARYLIAVVEHQQPVYVGDTPADAERWAYTEYSQYGYIGELNEILGDHEHTFTYDDVDLIYDGTAEDWEEEDW